MALTNNNLESVIAYLKQIFLNIDYDVKISYEKHYQSIVYLIFQLLGYQINVEYKTNIIVNMTVNRLPLLLIMYGVEMAQNPLTSNNNINKINSTSSFLFKNFGIYNIMLYIINA